MKAIRRAKIAEPPKEVKASLGSLNATGNGALMDGDPSANPEWLPPKQLLKPPGQLALADKELDEELTRILNANNPHAPQNIARWNNKEQMYKATPNMEHMVTHFEFEGYLLYKNDDKKQEDDAAAAAARAEGEAKPEGVDEGTGTSTEDAGTSTETPAAVPTAPDVTSLQESRKTSKAPARNQFNYSERATQTVNNPLRSRSTNTEPPPHRTFSSAVNQWSIYDAYMDDAQAKERAKEKAKNAGAKGHKDDDKHATLAAEAPHEDMYHSSDFRKRLATLERMANQNTFDEITQDFKYWDDAADDLRETKEGSLLPLWEFTYLKEKKKMVLALAWNPACPDLFVVAFGSYQFAKQGPGVLCCFSLKNPSFPEFTFNTPAGVTAIDVHPKRPHLIAAGLYDGSCLVFDLSADAANATTGPVTSGAGWALPAAGYGAGGAGGPAAANAAADARYRSDIKVQHTDPVWQVVWQPDDLDGNPNFYSVSSDGAVKQAILIKNELMLSDVIALQRNGMPLAGLCCDFNKANDHLFVVGTEEGALIKCSKDYNSQYLQTFEGHAMAIYRVLYNPFYTSVFLTASADWTVKLWDHTSPKPILLFDFGCPVADLAWAPFSSTTFAVATNDGKVVIYDLDVSKYDPICVQQVVGGKTHLTRIAFSPFDPVLVVGDDRGIVQAMKLSPNLRRAGRGGAQLSVDDQRDRLERVVMLALGKGNAGR
ncbi:cytoplasmic dynein with WD40 domain [Allomyces javanicus]|nr:cytoplasmic dynein with WD40 domain [Allomyces javanicus]